MLPSERRQNNRLVLPLAFCLAAIGVGCSQTGRQMQSSMLPAVVHDSEAVTHNSLLRYEIVKLPTGFSPYATSRHGVLLGTMKGRTAVYDRGSFTYLKPIAGYPLLGAEAVNDRGVVVGNGINNVSGGEQPVEWVHGKPYPLQTAEPPSSTPFYSNEASLINDRGQIVGSSNIILTYGSEPELLGTVVFYSTSAPPQPIAGCCGAEMSLNDRGNVAGFIQESTTPPENFGFLLSGTGCPSSTSSGLQNTSYFGLTNRNHVIGQFTTVYPPSSTIEYRFCQGATVTTLQGIPVADNDRDYIVGTSGSFPYLRTPDGHYYNLNSLLPSGSPTFTSVITINDKGEIIARASDTWYLLAPMASCSSLFQ